MNDTQSSLPEIPDNSNCRTSDSGPELALAPCSADALARYRHHAEWAADRDSAVIIRGLCLDIERLNKQLSQVAELASECDAVARDNSVFGGEQRAWMSVARRLRNLSSQNAEISNAPNHPKQ
jgi:hypothetical protein